MKRLFPATAAAVALLLLCGCTRRIYIPVESTAVRTDSIRTNLWHTDTVLMRDSVVMRTVGDTVTREIWRLRERFSRNGDVRYRTVRDTVVRNVPVEVELEKRVEVPAKLSLRQKAQMAVGRFCLPLLLLAIILFAIYKFKKH